MRMKESNIGSLLAVRFISWKLRFSNACSLRRSRSAAQLDAGNRRASYGGTERYEGLWRSLLRSITAAIGLSAFGRAHRPDKCPPFSTSRPRSRRGRRRDERGCEQKGEYPVCLFAASGH